MRFKLKVLWYLMRVLTISKLKNRTALEVYQQKKLKRFAKNVLSKSVFYKPYFVNGVFNWEAVPQISKTVFMDSFDAINTKGIIKKEAIEVALEAENSRNFTSEINGITVGLSTGTSGKRGVFFSF